jgi:UDP:flavonoid glycosyltransferase YjiC (YdhE family)
MRLASYEFSDEELHDAIERLTGDQELAGRLGAVSKRLQASPGRLRAVDLIERMVRD